MNARLRSLPKATVAAGLSVAAVLVAGCNPTDSRVNTEMSQNAAMSIVAESPGQTGPLLPHDSAAQRFQAFFNDMRAGVEAGEVIEVYASDAYFNDTLKELQGSEAIDQYFRNTVAMADRIDVQFEDAVQSGDNYYFRWIMDVTAPRLNGGQPVRSKGMTHVRFNEQEQVTLHQDYWDSSSGLFEHLPVIGSLLRWAKERI